MPRSVAKWEGGKQVIRYFVMYSMVVGPKRLADDLVKRLQAHFDGAKNYKFEKWSATDLDVGTDWHEAIQNAIDNCHFGLLLISPEFLGSRYITEYELPRFIADGSGRDIGERIAIPIALKPFVLDGNKSDLHGIDSRHIFYRDSKWGSKAYSQSSRAQEKDQFALELYERILRCLLQLPLLSGRRRRK